MSDFKWLKGFGKVRVVGGERGKVLVVLEDGGEAVVEERLLLGEAPPVVLRGRERKWKVGDVVRVATGSRGKWELAEVVGGAGERYEVKLVDGRVWWRFCRQIRGMEIGGGEGSGYGDGIDGYTEVKE